MRRLMMHHENEDKRITQNHSNSASPESRKGNLMKTNLRIAYNILHSTSREKTSPTSKEQWTVIIFLHSRFPFFSV